MVSFVALIEKFKEKGEKTGWTFVEVSSDIAEKLNPGVKKSYRVKGKLDTFPINQVALVPMGEGNFILPLKQSIRKEIKKTVGDKLKISLELDTSEIELSPLLLESLEDVPQAKMKFDKLPPSHKKYYSRWIEEAKTEPTKVKRIVQAIEGLSRGLDFGAMTKLNK